MLALTLGKKLFTTFDLTKVPGN